MRKDYQKGFTLAEILITLGIIGVVAALSIPSLINKINEIQTVSRVKKFYSTMNQTIKLAVEESGEDVLTWAEQASKSSGGSNWQGATYESGYRLWSKLAPYLKVANVCTKSESAGSSTVCGGNYYYRVYSLSDASRRVGQYAADYGIRIIMNDGSSFFLRTNGNCSTTSNDVCGAIWYDTNGFSKQPNVLGKDVFIFALLSDNRLRPDDGNTCTKHDTGASCSQHIIKYGNMKYPNY